MLVRRHSRSVVDAPTKGTRRRPQLAEVSTGVWRARARVRGRVREVSACSSKATSGAGTSAPPSSMPGVCQSRRGN